MLLSSRFSQKRSHLSKNRANQFAAKGLFYDSGKVVYVEQPRRASPGTNKPGTKPINGRLSPVIRCPVLPPSQEKQFIIRPMTIVD